MLITLLNNFLVFVIAFVIYAIAVYTSDDLALSLHFSIREYARERPLLPMILSIIFDYAIVYCGLLLFPNVHLRFETVTLIAYSMNFLAVQINRLLYDNPELDAFLADLKRNLFETLEAGGIIYTLGFSIISSVYVAFQTFIIALFIFWLVPLLAGSASLYGVLDTGDFIVLKEAIIVALISILICFRLMIHSLDFESYYVAGVESNTESDSIKIRDKEMKSEKVKARLDKKAKKASAVPSVVKTGSILIPYAYFVKFILFEFTHKDADFSIMREEKYVEGNLEKDICIFNDVASIRATMKNESWTYSMTYKGCSVHIITDMIMHKNILKFVLGAVEYRDYVEKLELLSQASELGMLNVMSERDSKYSKFEACIRELSEHQAISNSKFESMVR